ncbi:MAG: hypothetical protein ABIS84_09035 [Arachnia sp.]
MLKVTRSGIAAAMAGSLLVLMGCTPEGPVQSPSPSTSGVSSRVSAPPTSTPDDTESMPVEADDWGTLPPNNLDELRDLTDAQFPQQVLTFTLDGESGTAVARDASYVDMAALASMSASVTLGRKSYKGAVDSLADPAYQGRAVCGHPIRKPSQIVCLMVGLDHRLRVGTAADLSIEEVAAFTEAIYDAL